MSFEIDVLFQPDLPDTGLTDEDVRLAVQTTLVYRLVSSATISIVIADHILVRSLNQRFLQHDYNTDVLSFLLSDIGALPLDGEVYVDQEMAQERCLEFDSSVQDELLRYVIHGILHLSGLDDTTQDLKGIMSRHEDSILKMIRS